MNRMSDEMRDFLEGMSVSIDISTSEATAGHRLFGTVSEVMDCPGDKHGVTLLIYDAEANFERVPAGYLCHDGTFMWHGPVPKGMCEGMATMSWHGPVEDAVSGGHIPLYR